MNSQNTTSQITDDSTSIAELTIAFRRILKLAAEPAGDSDEQLYLIRYEATNGLAAARSLSEPAVVS